MCFQVIDWLNNHGDIFLQKNTSVGRSLNRAKTLQKSHEHFEAVAQVGSLLTGFSVLSAFWLIYIDGDGLGFGFQTQ